MKPAGLAQQKLVARAEPSHPRDPPNVALARALIEEGFNRGDVGAVDRLVDRSMVEHQRLPPGVPANRAASKAIIQALRGGFRDFHLQIIAVDAVGDRVWLLMHATGTHTGPFLGMQPTGKTISVDVMDMVVVRDGKIVEHWGVPDQLAVLEQLGALDGP